MKQFILILYMFLFINCVNSDSAENVETKKKLNEIEIDSFKVEMHNVNVIEKPKQKEYTLYEDSLIGLGFVDVQKIDSTFVLDLKYTKQENFTNAILYTDLQHCFLQKEVVTLLVKAHNIIKEKKPNTRIVLYDCLRPQSVQYKMWDIVKGTDKARYVAEPKYGSIHNFGAAVDLGLIDTLGNYLDMGSPFDEFSILAQPRHEMELFKKGEIAREALDNRWLLKTSMKAVGFKSILTEWWHYNAYSLKYTRQNFSIVK